MSHTDGKWNQADAERLRDMIAGMDTSERICRLKDAMLGEPRRMSVEQAVIITQSYRKHPDEPRVLQRAHALAASLLNIRIRIDPGELIVGNRTAEVRAGVVFPESGISWVADELATLPTREQDPFDVRPEDARTFIDDILPFWSGKTLEDIINNRHGTEVNDIKTVAKINQTDHAQGHICPDTRGWLRDGPAGIAGRVNALITGAASESGAPAGGHPYNITEPI